MAFAVNPPKPKVKAPPLEPTPFQSIAAPRPVLITSSGKTVPFSELDKLTGGKEWPEFMHELMRDGVEGGDVSPSTPGQVGGISGFDPGAFNPFFTLASALLPGIPLGTSFAGRLGGAALDAMAKAGVGFALSKQPGNLSEMTGFDESGRAQFMNVAPTGRFAGIPTGFESVPESEEGNFPPFTTPVSPRSTPGDRSQGGRDSGLFSLGKDPSGRDLGFVGPQENQVNFAEAGPEDSSPTTGPTGPAPGDPGGAPGTGPSSDGGVGGFGGGPGGDPDFRQGGWVQPGQDVTLEPGEFVVRASVARRFKELLERLNSATPKLETHTPLDPLSESFSDDYYESDSGVSDGPPANPPMRYEPGSRPFTPEEIDEFNSSPFTEFSRKSSPSQQGLRKIRKMSISLSL